MSPTTPASCTARWGVFLGDDPGGERSLTRDGLGGVWLTVPCGQAGRCRPISVTLEWPGAAPALVLGMNQRAEAPRLPAQGWPGLGRPGHRPGVQEQNLSLPAAAEAAGALFGIEVARAPS